jgi:hypothetical protein
MGKEKVKTLLLTDLGLFGKGKLASTQEAKAWTKNRGPCSSAGADPSVAEWGHRPPLKFSNSYIICAYLKEISLDFTNLYKECPQSINLPPLLYFSGSATALLGYAFHSIGYRFFIVKSEVSDMCVGTIMELNDATFFEDIFPMKGLSRRCLVHLVKNYLQFLNPPFR